MSVSDYASGAQTAARSRARIQRAGRAPSGHPVWTSQEDEFLRKHYPNSKALSKSLPSRTVNAMRARARLLGIGEKRPQWSAAERSRLRRLYPAAPTEDLEGAFPGRTLRQIRDRANAWGIYRKRKPPVSTGDPLLDAVLQRAFQLNYKMEDLDELADGKGYFRRARWRFRNGGRKPVGKALKAMGGRIVVEWDDG